MCMYSACILETGKEGSKGGGHDGEALPDLFIKMNNIPFKI